MFIYYRTNLEVTKDQISDQHAYVQQLRSTEADQNLVEQEKLVEKQLRKRQVHDSLWHTVKPVLCDHPRKH
jgi:hypothetical protein